MSFRPKTENFQRGLMVQGSRPSSGIGALEGLSGFVEDINNLTFSELSDPAQLDRVVKERFGPNVSTADVMRAMETVREISDLR